MKHGQEPANIDPRLAAIPAGVVICLGFDAADVPAGFLICRGAFVSQAANPNLYAAIGHKFNRDGAGTPVDPGDGTFRLPDFRRKFPIGPGTGGAGDRPNGQRGGTWDHTHGVGSLAAAHDHGPGTLSIPAHNHGHSLGGQDHNHFTSETVKAAIAGGDTTRGRSFGARTVGSGGFGLSGGVNNTGGWTPGGRTASANPALTGATGAANPPAIMLEFAIRSG